MNTTTQETTTVQTKTCICCGETKPIEKFYRDKKASDGHQSYCKRCLNLKAVVRETLTDEQMVQALRFHGWEVTCKRTITEEL